MAGVPEKVLNWLYSVLTSEYKDVNRTYHDAAEALSHYPSLTTRTEVYTYENGTSALLLLLSGTLPVTFRGATYGFPVAIWMPYAYPRESPIVYITPSPDMVVRPGQHVSGDGRVYHPYLAQWAQYWDKSTLFDFLAVLRGVFAKEPPVRSRQPQHNAPAQQAPPPVPPPPAERGPSVHDAGSARPRQGLAPPPRPPKPGEQSPQTAQSSHDRYSQPPPLPPHPPQQPRTPSQYQQPQRSIYGAPPQWQQPVHAPAQNGSRQGSYGMSMSPATPGARQHGQPLGYQSNTQDGGSPASPLPQRYPPQHLHPQHQQHPRQAAPPAAPKPPINLLDDSLTVTLPSQHANQPALPLPPVPPNPEKDALLRALSHTLVTQTRTTISSNISALAPLRSQHAALSTAYSRLESELVDLQQVDAALLANEQILKGAMEQADGVMNDARRRQVPDVDDLLVAPTLVGGQLYTLVSEEKGIADVLFVLGRGLDKGRVGVEVFVKQTRSLAREQFLKKALIRKIGRGMGLDEYQVR